MAKIKPKAQTKVTSKLKSIPTDKYPVYKGSTYPIQEGKPSGSDYKETPATKKLPKNARAGQKALRDVGNEAFEWPKNKKGR